MLHRAPRLGAGGSQVPLRARTVPALQGSQQQAEVQEPLGSQLEQEGGIKAAPPSAQARPGTQIKGVCGWRGAEQHGCAHGATRGGSQAAPRTGRVVRGLGVLAAEGFGGAARSLCLPQPLGAGSLCAKHTRLHRSTSS